MARSPRKDHAHKRRLPHESEKETFIRFTNWVITAISFALVGWFAFLQHFDLTKFEDAANQLDSDFLWKGAVTLYYTSWVFGTKFDTSAQSSVFIRFPTRQWPFKALGMVFLLGVVAALLCWAEGDIKRFSLVLLGFILVDYANWRYLVHYLRPSVEESHYYYVKDNDFFAAERLSVVIRRVQGKWKWWRLSIGLPVALFICAFAYVNAVRDLLLSTIAWLDPNSPVASGANVAAGWLVLTWVLLVEFWIWLVRVKATIQINYLNELEANYALRRT